MRRARCNCIACCIADRPCERSCGESAALALPRSYVIGEHGVHTQYLRRISLCSPTAGPRCPIWSLLRCLWEREKEEASPRVPFAFLLLHVATSKRFSSSVLSFPRIERMRIAIASADRSTEKHDPTDDWALQIANFVEGRYRYLVLGRESYFRIDESIRPHNNR